MDASIILQGRPVNALAAMSGGYAVRAQADEMARQNALAQFLQVNGAGIMAGDRNALAGLAGFDPTTAMGLQSSLLSQDATRLGMDATRQGMGFAAQDQQFQIDDRERADALMRTRAIEAALAQGDMATATRLWQAEGLPPEAMGNPQAMLATIVGLGSNLEAYGAVRPSQAEADLREFNGDMYDFADPMNPRLVLPGEDEAPGFRPATPEEAAAALEFGQMGADGRYYAPEQESGMIVYGPNGEPIMAQGGAATLGSLTESESRDVNLATRAREALAVLDSVGAEVLTSRADTFLGADWNPMNFLGFGFGRQMQSDPYQMAEQAARNFVAIVLRKDTGAAVTDTEMRNYTDIFIPEPGDGAARLEVKRQAREAFVNALEAGMNEEGALAQAEALARSAQAALAAEAQAAPEASGGFVPAPGAVVPPPPAAAAPVAAPEAAGPVTPAAQATIAHVRTYQTEADLTAYIERIEAEMAERGDPIPPWLEAAIVEQMRIVRAQGR